MFSGLIIISVSHKEVAVVVLALFIANFLLYTALYLLSKVKLIVADQFVTGFFI